MPLLVVLLRVRIGARSCFLDVDLDLLLLLFVVAFLGLLLLLLLLWWLLRHRLNRQSLLFSLNVHADLSDGGCGRRRVLLMVLLLKLFFHFTIIKWLLRLLWLLWRVHVVVCWRGVCTALCRRRRRHHLLR